MLGFHFSSFSGTFEAIWSLAVVICFDTTSASRSCVLFISSGLLVVEMCFERHVFTLRESTQTSAKQLQLVYLLK